jgi:cytochrome c biogenesis protein CcmG/thiol:disulfide interchange protein DsbE
MADATTIAPPHAGRRYLIAALFTVAFAGLLFIFYSAFGTDPHAVPFKLAGQPAPAFKLLRLDTGETVTLDQFKGRPIVLNFWASWCGPCKMEHPVLEWGARRYQNDAVFLGVLFEDTEDNAKQFLRQHGHSFPQLLDPSSRMPVDYGVTGVPETYFIDRAGTIKGKYVGPVGPEILKTRIDEIVATAGGR